jgi:hypothetical protein
MRPTQSFNTAPILDVLAPGEFVDSSYLAGGHAVLSGTSMASPHAEAARRCRSRRRDDADEIQARRVVSPPIPTTASRSRASTAARAPLPCSPGAAR